MPTQEMNLNYRATAYNLNNQSEVGEVIEDGWACKLHDLPHLFYVDWYAEREDKLIAWIEFKQYRQKSFDREHVWMNVNRKYKTLSGLSSVAPAFYFVRFDDGVLKYINVKNVGQYEIIEAGEYNRWGPGKHDLEPVYNIPIAEMKDFDF